MYTDRGDGNRTSTFKEAIDPKSTVQIHFNLEGIDDAKGLARSMDGVDSAGIGDYTARELSQIKNAPASVQARVTWYDEHGDVVSSPFGG
ncbi:hypothetical protein [Streptomyces ipomoeae]|uniref:hypothetical protein n=1 Tax=Streptomyces ipomoeae TaxID=103232 RepID=UPI0011473303|nr:hypothetical protein [Streptomyces ipomoeae]MDX2938410.1 hypothetical protein [Streptomyces ipomoeae]TQE23773.1 hypothetical protein SipoB123_19685 [Streptomyces ipomoeae]